jgi:hypothetical protein
MSDDPLRLQERNFDSLADWEVDHCWSHDFTRLVPGLIRRVKEWRARVQIKEGQDAFDAYLLHQGGRVVPGLQIEDRLFLIPPGAYYLFPEWPDTPYLKIPEEIRFRRLKKLSEREKDWLEPQEKEENREGRKKKKSTQRVAGRRGRTALRELVPHPAEYGLNPVSYPEYDPSAIKWSGQHWSKFTESLRDSVRLSNALRAFRSDREELVVFRISWNLSNEQILALISKWLPANRRVPFQYQGTLGRSHPLAKKKMQLDCLRKYLIVQDSPCGWKVVVGRKRLFRDRAKSNECRKVVEAIITELSSPPGCTG